MFKKLFTQKEKGCCDVQIIEVKDDEKKEDCCEGKKHVVKRKTTNKHVASNKALGGPGVFCFTTMQSATLQ
ncbi:hypothetical protein AF6_1631 [Anoxybacillus flavithermus TNO-09.006]|uniref:hypothetical protein n=1 Tax=Anoxybacillus flavithermus TaxID=33934 RepID=UPI0002A709C7|nr:hypothetical protein [Anoxybacillus flavithermus]ELK21592.1 hypothetical protein AF6_1631 [Anoxybacillus flavithermus TNO-09.006]